MQTNERWKQLKRNQENEIMKRRNKLVVSCRVVLCHSVAHTVLSTSIVISSISFVLALLRLQYATSADDRTVTYSSTSCVRLLFFVQWKLFGSLTVCCVTYFACRRLTFPSTFSKSLETHCVYHFVFQSLQPVGAEQQIDELEKCHFV